MIEYDESGHSVTVKRIGAKGRNRPLANIRSWLGNCAVEVLELNVT